MRKRHGIKKESQPTERTTAPQPTNVIHTKDEQKLPTHEKDKQAGSERQIISRSTEEEEKEEEEVTEHFTFNFSQKRERTLTNKEQPSRRGGRTCSGKSSTAVKALGRRRRRERGELCKGTLERAGDEASIEAVAVMLS